MNLDIIIATAGNIESKKFSLYYTIRSIMSQSKQPKSINIVVNDSVDAIKDKVISEFGEFVNVIDGTSKSNNISYARNLGVKVTDSEILLFMDDDVVIGRNDFFEEIIEKMQHIDFYCGATRLWTTVNWDRYIQKSYSINHIQQILKYKSYLPKSIDRNTGQLSFHEFSYIGHFGAIKRDVFNRIGGFDEEYKEWSYQDTDLMMRLCIGKYNYQLMSNDNIYIYHLSHEVDKSNYSQINKKRFHEKQNELGIKFHLNHFFGIFDDDEYAILS